MSIHVRRVYESATPEDGYRVLIDHIWPRGVRKEEARLDEWAHALAVSTPLRRWFGHDPAKWDEFSRRYRTELLAPEHRAALAALARRAAEHGDDRLRCPRRAAQQCGRPRRCAARAR